MKLKYEDVETWYKVTPEDDDDMYTLKSKVFALTEPEKRILLLYTELGSYSEVARMMNCSAPTVKKYVDIIREKLK